MVDSNQRKVNYEMIAPPVDDVNRLRDLTVDGWDWLIQSFNPFDMFCMETVHKGDHSRDMELEAISKCNRKSLVVDLKPYRDLARKYI